MPAKVAAALVSDRCCPATAAAVGRRAGLGLTAVWCALAGFYLTRLSSHLLYYGWRRGGVFAGRTKLGSKVE